METPGALNRSPIREAVLDVFVEGVKVSARDLQAFGKRLGDDFPTEHVSHFVSANFAVEDGEPKTSARLVERGYQYRSPDERDVLQARIDGFSINRLAPYTSGDRLFELARRWWAIYLEVAQPEAIRGVALRYINEVFVPCAGGAFDRTVVATYLPLIPPGVNSGAVKEMDSFSTRVVYRTTNGDLAVMATVSGEPYDGSIPFIIDIEVAHHQRWTVDSSGPWEALERLRWLKNELFVASTSQKLREEFR